MNVLDYQGPKNRTTCVASVQHNCAVNRRYTSRFGAPFRKMLEAWEQMAVEHRRMYDLSIGNDGYVGPIWEDMARSLRSLLSADIGGFDCGSLDANILRILADNDIDTEGW